MVWKITNNSALICTSLSTPLCSVGRQADQEERGWDPNSHGCSAVSPPRWGDAPCPAGTAWGRGAAGGSGGLPTPLAASWVGAAPCSPARMRTRAPAPVPPLPRSRSSQSRAFRNRSGQVVINYWRVCHPNCTLSSDHSQPFVWQWMPYKIFMHRLASLALSFFSRNIIALDAFLHFPKIFFLQRFEERREVRRTAEQTSLQVRHLLSQASCVIKRLRGNIHTGKCDENDTIFPVYHLHFTVIMSSPSLSVCMAVTYPHKHTHTHKNKDPNGLLDQKFLISTNSLRNVAERKAARPAQLIVAGQLIQLLLLWSVPCAHGIDRRAKFGLSLYTSDIQKTFLPATWPQEIVCWFHPLQLLMHVEGKGGKRSMTFVWLVKGPILFIVGITSVAADTK